VPRRPAVAILVMLAVVALGPPRARAAAVVAVDQRPGPIPEATDNGATPRMRERDDREERRGVRFRAQPTPLPPRQFAPATPPAGSEPTHVFWYLARAAGLSAYLLLFVTVALGLGLHSRALDRLIARWQTFDLHQFTAVFGLGMLALHVGSLLADHYIGFTVEQLLVPFASPYRPVWTGLGVIALYVLVVLTASFQVRPLIGQRAWRMIHYSSFGAYLLALLHGILSGTDGGEWWVRALYGTTGLMVAFLTLHRLSWARPMPTTGERLASTASRLTV